MFTDLPKDIKKIILFSLPPEDYFNCCYVCKEWKNLTFNNIIFEDKKRQFLEDKNYKNTVNGAKTQLVNMFTKPEHLPENLNDDEKTLLNDLRGNLKCGNMDEDESKRLMSFMDNDIFNKGMKLFYTEFNSHENKNFKTEDFINTINKVFNGLSNEEKAFFTDFDKFMKRDE